MVWGEKEGGRGEEVEKEGGVNDVGRKEKERRVKDTMIEGVIMQPMRTLALGKFYGINKDDPS